MANSTIPPHPNSPQEKLSTYRQLKVRKSYYHYQHGDFQHRDRHVNSPPVPWVHIKGYWLNKAGFTIDTPLSVEVRQGCIILKTQAAA